MLPRGTVYVAGRKCGQWTDQRALGAAASDQNDHFGEAVATDGTIVVIGAAGEDASAPGIDGDETDNSTDGARAAYVFE